MDEILHEKNIRDYYVKQADGLMVRLFNHVRPIAFDRYTEMPYEINFCHFFYGIKFPSREWDRGDGVILISGQLFAVMGGPQLWPVYDRFGNIIEDDSKAGQIWAMDEYGQLYYRYTE